MALIVFRVFVAGEVLKLQSCAAAENPLFIGVNSTHRAVNIFRAFDGLFQILPRFAEENTNAILAVFLLLDPELAKHSIRLAAAACAAIEDFKYRAGD